MGLVHDEKKKQKRAGMVEDRLPAFDLSGLQHVKSPDGMAVLICADSVRDVLPRLSGEWCVVSDPPYGIKLDTAWLDGMNEQRFKPANTSQDNSIRGDAGDLDLSWILNQKHRLIWGFPYIRDSHAAGWFVWDKRPGMDTERSLGNPVEMASTTLWKGFRIVRCMWNGYYRHNGEKRVDHPTQKPLKVMARCVEASPAGLPIIDPFMGSGSTGVACARLNRPFVGIEIEEKYYEIAVRRIITEYGSGFKV